MPADGDVVLSIGGSKLAGWTDVDITCSVERMPWSFNVGLTEKYPGDASALVVQPGDVCTVSIGGDLVITGYVDRLQPSFNKDTHTIRVIGRSKSADLVDCSAEWPNGQIVGASALEICTKLAQPYGITVKGKTDVGPPIPQLNLTLGETAYAICERTCRYRGLLIYDQADGSVLLDVAGSDSMDSGVAEGPKGNVQEASADYSIDGRYSDYKAFLQSMDVLGDLGEGGNQIGATTDEGVKRHRQLDLIAEAGGGGRDVCLKRALWESARRFGRGFVLTVVVDSWRSAGGTLWAPNKKVPVSIPSLKVPDTDWVIATVRFLLSPESGTQAVLELIPRNGLLPEPVLLLPIAADVPPGGTP